MWPWTTKPVISVNFFFYWDFSSESWRKVFYWCMISYDKTIFGRDVTIWTFGIWRCKKKNLNIEKIIFKVVQMKFLAMHITYQKLRFGIYGRKFTKYLHGTWSLLNILIILGIKEKNYNFDPYNVFLAIATNIPQRLKTSFVVQGHKWYMRILNSSYSCLHI